jgi:hypothetical protein
MKDYKFTIIYYLILVVPFLLYTLVNVYVYIFTNNHAMSEKVLHAGMIGLVMGLFGMFIVLWESEL